MQLMLLMVLVWGFSLPVFAKEHQERDFFNEPTSTDPIEDLFYDDSVRRENLDWVRQCTGAVVEGKTVRAKYTHKQWCVKPTSTWDNPVDYVLSKRAGEMNVKFKIRFILDEGSVTKERAAEMVKSAYACVDPINKVWGRYGIYLDLSFDSSLTQDSPNPQQQVNLFDTTGRSNALNFYYWNNEKPANETRRQDKFCRLLLHETGHMVGLDDEYEQDGCPDRFVSKERDPISVMKNIWGMSWDDLDFYSRHVKTVLAPLCK